MHRNPSRLLCLLLLMPAWGVPPAPPALWIAGEHIDFGEVRSGTVLSHTFRLENRGERLLQIRNIRTSCGCTASELSTREIPAGGSATLAATLDLTGRSGPQAEQIRIQSNDPQNPDRVLRLTAHAIPRVRVTPRTLNFQQISAETPPSGQIRIEATSGSPLQVTGIRTASQQLETHLTEVRPGQLYQLEVRPLELLEAGHFTERLEILTDDPEEPSIPVLIMWQIAEALIIAPRQLNLVLTDPPQPVRRFVLVRGAPDLDPPPEVLSAEWEGRGIPASITPAGDFGIRIEFTFIPQADMDGETLVLRTNVPGFEILTIPVRIVTP